MVVFHFHWFLISILVIYLLIIDKQSKTIFFCNFRISKSWRILPSFILEIGVADHNWQSAVFLRLTISIFVPFLKTAGLSNIWIGGLVLHPLGSLFLFLCANLESKCTHFVSIFIVLSNKALYKSPTRNTFTPEANSQFRFLKCGRFWNIRL